MHLKQKDVFSSICGKNAFSCFLKTIFSLQAYSFKAGMVSLLEKKQFPKRDTNVIWPEAAVRSLQNQLQIYTTKDR